MNRLQMHDGWEYVAGAYATTVVVFGVWFWMIGAKLRRQSRARMSQPTTPAAATAPEAQVGSGG